VVLEGQVRRTSRDVQNGKNNPDEQRKEATPLGRRGLCTVNNSSMQQRFIWARG